jgi:hypothetical protein
MEFLLVFAENSDDLEEGSGVSYPGVEKVSLQRLEGFSSL